jgi:hypothetical protein
MRQVCSSIKVGLYLSLQWIWVDNSKRGFGEAIATHGVSMDALKGKITHVTFRAGLILFPCIFGKQ